jgi:hypothetical protein
MGLTQAIKRSYPFLVPPSLRAPRTFIRRNIERLGFYVVGLTTGMYICARPGEGDQISHIAIAALSVLLVLKWWSGASSQEHAKP